ncbi:MAG: DUF1634 domain-containing protein [Thermoleophilia bacterium]|nr:DUF1634 domain-containing protein [Thermoleophilia bacterium]
MSFPSTDTYEPTEEHSLNQAVSAVLVAGIVVSVSLMVLGLVLEAVKGGASPETSVAIPKIPRGLAGGDPGAVLSAGLIALLLTPALRVALLLGVYLSRRQWLFAALSFTVLGVMVLSILLGLG